MKKHYIKKLFATVAVLLCCTTANAHDFEVDGIYYKILSASDLTAQVTYKGNSYDEFTDEYSGEVIIPSTVTYKSKVLTVTTIGKSAFSGCDGITSITIPNSITSIESFAFNDCTSLKNLRIEDGTETLSLGYNSFNNNYDYSIGEGLFYDCPLEILYLGRNLSYNLEVNQYRPSRCFGYSPFYYKKGLISVTIGNNVTSVREYAFYKCSYFEEVHISDLSAWCNIVFYGPDSNPLSYARNLYLNGELVTDLVIPNSVTEIKDYVFRNCSGLTSVTIPNCVTSIGSGAFKDCSGLKTVINLSELPIIKRSSEYGYVGYYANKVINAPNGLIDRKCVWLENETGITLAAYLGSETELTLPIEYNGNSVTSIGNYAFAYCAGLTNIKIPNSVTSIGYEAFYGCTSLTNIKIPNCVTTIGERTFVDCIGLTSVTIGNSVTNIEGRAFINCTAIESIYLLGETPPSVGGENFTESQYIDIVLYVPQGSLETYQAADTWKNFWDIREINVPETDSPDAEVQKCATPVITFKDNGLDITCDTQDADFITTVTCSDANTYNSGRIDFSATYEVTSYAVKLGYEDSESVTAILCWIENSNGSSDIIEVASTPVLIFASNGDIAIKGVKINTEIIIYNVNGTMLDKKVANGNDIIVNTSLLKGNIAIVNVEGKAVKVIMQ